MPNIEKCALFPTVKYRKVWPQHIWFVVAVDTYDLSLQSPWKKLDGRKLGQIYGYTQCINLSLQCVELGHRQGRKRCLWLSTFIPPWIYALPASNPSSDPTKVKENSGASAMQKNSCPSRWTNLSISGENLVHLSQILVQLSQTGTFDSKFEQNGTFDSKFEQNGTKFCVVHLISTPNFQMSWQLFS